MADEEEVRTFLFEMDCETALHLYEEMVKRGARTEEEKLEILLEFAEEGRLKRAFHTGRSKEQIIEDLAKHQNVLYVSPKQEYEEYRGYCAHCNEIYKDATGVFTDEGMWLCDMCSNELWKEIDDEMAN
jgi:hypothetical protein